MRRLQVQHQTVVFGACHVTPGAADIWQAMRTLLLALLVAQPENHSIFLDGLHRSSRALLIAVWRSLSSGTSCTCAVHLIFRRVSLSICSVPNVTIGRSFCSPLLAAILARFYLV